MWPFNKATKTKLFTYHLTLPSDVTPLQLLDFLRWYLNTILVMQGNGIPLITSFPIICGMSNEEWTSCPYKDWFLLRA